jgi:hypothetical protein
LSAGVNNARLPAQAAVCIVGPAMQASPSNGPVTLTTMIAHPSPPLRGQDDARPLLAIMPTWRVAFVFILLGIFFHKKIHPKCFKLLFFILPAL